MTKHVYTIPSGEKFISMVPGNQGVVYVATKERVIAIFTKDGHHTVDLVMQTQETVNENSGQGN